MAYFHVWNFHFKYEIEIFSHIAYLVHIWNDRFQVSAWNLMIRNVYVNMKVNIHIVNVISHPKFSFHIQNFYFTSEIFISHRQLGHFHKRNTLLAREVAWLKFLTLLFGTCISHFTENRFIKINYTHEILTTHCLLSWFVNDFKIKSKYHSIVFSVLSIF